MKRKVDGFPKASKRKASQFKKSPQKKSKVEKENNEEIAVTQRSIETTEKWRIGNMIINESRAIDWEYFGAQNKIYRGWFDT